MRALLTMLLALALSACTLPSFSLGTPTSPAPLAQTVIDDTALSTAWKSFDVALDAINLAIDAKAITPGSARANSIADAIDKVTKFLTAAESAAAAGSATDYKVALANASAAITELRSVLKG
jgi:hypothetical protein